MKIFLSFSPPHMDTIGAVSLQSFLVICDQISLCNDIT